MTKETVPPSSADGLRPPSAEERKPAILVKLGMLYGLLIGLIAGIAVTSLVGW